MAKFELTALLNQQSKAPEQSGESFAIQQIPLEKIRPSNANAYGIRDVEELAASIEALGLLHNIVVKAPDGGGMHEIISGERRFRAFALLRDAGHVQYATIPCKVETSPGAAFDELKLLHANAMARELSDYEKTYQAARMRELLEELRASGHEFKGRMRDAVAELLETSPAQIGRMESIAKNLIPTRMDEFRGGKIGISKAYELSKLPPEAQAKLGAKTAGQGRKARERKTESATNRIDRKEIIRLLSEIADALERGATTDYDVASVCRDAALLLGERKA